jgi:formate hydrogenlyase transcriptional activator
MVTERQFRADLFYRLSVFPIELPPLRDRPEDLRLLVHHFAMDYAARMHKQITAISEEFIAVLARHSWPGNVRELQNFIERSVILLTGVVLSGPLPGLLISEDPILRNPLSRISQLYARSGNSKPDSDVGRVWTLAEAEREHISEVVEMTNGLIAGKGGAAEVLGVPPSTLRNRMKKLGIKSFSRLAAAPRLLTEAAGRKQDFAGHPS